MNANSVISQDKVLQSALKLARNQHWEALRLADVAEDLQISLVALRRIIKDKENLIDLLWDQADAAMLAQCHFDDFISQSFATQFEQCVMSWLMSLHPCRQTVREMLMVRAEPGHLHIQIPTLTRVSQTVQWMRELCQRDALFFKRAAEETMLTCLFVNHVRIWLHDESENCERTRESLRRQTDRAVQLEKFWPGK